MNALYRQWQILSRIPREPRTVGTRELKEHLEYQGCEVSDRMIQRDLEQLTTMGLFPLACEQEGRSNRWFWPKSAKLMSFPGMDVASALALSLIQRHLTGVLPSHVINDLQSYFDAADRTLSNTSSLGQEWCQKIAIIHEGPERVRRSLDADVQAAIYLGLFTNKQLQVVYNARGGEGLAYHIHPLGLVSKADVIYLIGTINDYEDIRQFAMSRFISVVVLDESSKRPSGFVLADYIHEQAAFQYPIHQEQELLRLKIMPEFVFYFNESALGQDQQVSGNDDIGYEVCVTTTITEELEWWLMGRANLIRVIEPLSLKERLLDALTRSVEYYKQQP
ncbi:MULTISPECIES: helix-turn-helix transcriptional regulator [Amphritea]|uniref:helix-turn-helix transcriptional regulator n=1 Tax=Amphritea TaxID=515417 RepID=UPI001C06E7BA|nr:MULTISPECIES: WYL domain-containing protein [Amphritea]MBU2964041.1 WYL domain-containing protein [Amphritea atlantica]